MRAGLQEARGNGSLTPYPLSFVNAAPRPRPVSVDRSTSSGALELIQGSMSAQKMARQAPLLAALHRVADGSLCGVVLAVLALSGLTLHWQHRWTVAFRQLEETRNLSHRLTESTAMLERHLLEESTRPAAMVPTKVANLVYLERPQSSDVPKNPGWIATLQSWMNQPIHRGY